MSDNKLDGAAESIVAGVKPFMPRKKDVWLTVIVTERNDGKLESGWHSMLVPADAASVTAEIAVLAQQSAGST